MIEIDCSLGEGGGQVLRSSLTLSLLTRQPVRLTNIRAKRPKPGLQPQHLAAVKAAAAISAGQVEGMYQNSTALTFAPGEVQPGDYRFDIGTAGATSLVLQTIFLPLALASGRPKAEAAPTPPVSRAWQPGLQSNDSSEITLIGGTHVPWSPSFHYLDLQWLPYLRRMGFVAHLELELAGFYPQGNGQVIARIAPLTPQPWGERDSPRIGGRGAIAPLDLPERGALKGIRGIAAVANLDTAIAERMRTHALRRLQGRHNRIEIELLDLPARVKGAFLLLLAEFKYGSACYVGLGALGKRAEQMADEACLWLEKFLATHGAVDEYLADQLLLPLTFASGPSEYRTSKATEHLQTNAEIIRAFGVAEIVIEEDGGRSGLVRIMPS
jgi:RNA 3'-terminal phosphate cyclase (ATP)